MKRLIALIVGLLLVLAFVVAPATAGVVGPGGGTDTKTTTTTSHFTDRVVSTSTRYLSPIIKDQGKRIVSTKTSEKTLSTSVSGVNGRSYGYRPVGTVISSSKKKVGSDSWDTFLRTTYEEVGDKLVDTNYTQVGTTFDRTESTRTVTTSKDIIIIGDVDSNSDGSGGWVAQGSRNVHDDVHNYYWNDLHKENVRQKTLNKYQDYERNTINYYRKYITKVTYISPIVLNMDGTGKLMASNGEYRPHTEMYSDRLAIFDFYGSGEPSLLEWVGPNDGLLCVPKADGRVDGTCLFGIANGYDDGYEELAVTRDANKDGVISGAELEGLYVWQDRNGNAIAGTKELKTVQELGITEISVKHNNFKSSFKMNGETCTSWDWWPSIRGLERMVPPQG